MAARGKPGGVQRIVGSSLAESPFIRVRASAVYSPSSFARLNVSRPEPAPRVDALHTPVRFGSPHAVFAENATVPFAALPVAPLPFTNTRIPTSKAAPTTTAATIAIARLLIGPLRSSLPAGRQTLDVARPTRDRGSRAIPGPCRTAICRGGPWVSSMEP